MLVKRFWSNTVIEQQTQEHSMYVQIGPLDNQLTTNPIKMHWELSVE